MIAAARAATAHRFDSMATTKDGRRNNSEGAPPARCLIARAQRGETVNEMRARVRARSLGALLSSDQDR